MFTLFRC